MTFVFKIGVFQTNNIIFTIKNKRTTGIKGHQSIRRLCNVRLIAEGLIFAYHSPS